MNENTSTLVALGVAVLVGVALVLLIMKRVIRRETMDSLAEAVRGLPVTIGSGLFGKIYEYSRAAVLTVEQLVRRGDISHDDQERKDAAMTMVENAAKVDEVPFGAAESEIASLCIEAAVAELPHKDKPC